MSDYAHMNKLSGNVACDVVSAKKYMTSKLVKTPKILNTMQVDVNGAGFHEGNITAKNLKLEGNLELGGVIVGSRDNTPMTEEQMRREQAYQNRVCASQEQYAVPLPPHLNNGDEERYPHKIASFAKGLPHNDLGEVIPEAFNAFVAGLNDPYTLDCVELVGDRKLVNPLCGYAFDTEGADSHAMDLAPAPTFDSAEQAGEMVEDYWMALLRDVNFRDYNNDVMVAAACTDMNKLSDFRGPKVNGQVTPQTLFRGNSLGCTVGPHLSQFFYLPCPFGVIEINQKASVPVAGDDFMTNFAEWKFIQEGNSPTRTQTLDSVRRYLRNGRDIAEWVHRDELFQAYFIASLILLGRGCPLNSGNPYLSTHPNQDPFGTLGGPDILATTAEVSTRALKAIWHKKWLVHRRLRPEAFGARVDRHKSGAATYPIHEDLFNSDSLDLIHSRHGNYLLPMAYPEGSPMHPSYGAGHATVAGACTTILKAMFDTENFVLENPLQPNPNGTDLNAYNGEVLTAEGELNKLANNIALGRDFAGVHWRTDNTLELGEEVAIKMLRDRKKMYHPSEGGISFNFRKFDGTRVTI
jgi:hypothetical protein